MSLRDPKKNPNTGDVVNRWGTSREITGIERNERGTLTHVDYNKDHRITIGAWRAWCDSESRVVRISDPS